MRLLDINKLHGLRLNIEHGPLKTSWIYRISYWTNVLRLSQIITDIEDQLYSY